MNAVVAVSGAQAGAKADIKADIKTGIEADVEAAMAEMPPNILALGGGHDTLPADVEYSLDCEQEYGNISADERAYVELFSENLLRWFHPYTLGGASEFPAEIKRRYAAWRTTAAPGDRMALDWAGISGLRWLFEECAGELSNELISRHEQMGVYTDDVAHALRDIDVATTHAFERLAQSGRQVAARAIEDIDVHGVEVFRSHRGRIEHLYREAEPVLRERRAATQRILRERTEFQIDRASQIVSTMMAARKRTPQTRRREKLARRAMARSFDLLKSVAGEPRAKAWLDGEEVAVAGRKFDFRLRVSDVSRQSYGAVDVFVTDKNSVELAKLCVYVPDTPALDQVAAMVLHVISGNEDEIIRKGNVIRSSEAARDNADFNALKQRSVVAPPAMEYAESARIREFVMPPVRETMAERFDQLVWGQMIGALGSEVGWLETLADRQRDITVPYVYERGSARQPDLVEGS